VCSSDLTSVVFVDYGYGDRRGERKVHHDISVGAGVRISVFDQAIVRLEWGFPVGDRPITEGPNQGRFHLSVDFQDKFPEEFARIAKEVGEDRIKNIAWQLVDAELEQPESPIRKKMDDYLYMAESARQEGDLERSKECYEKISDMSKQLYKQAEDYVRTSMKHEDELKGYDLVARKYYKEGRKEYAKQLWQRAINEARPKPLVFTIQ
jgi:tetratricopeptide (TPR) repeat protein